MNFLGHLVAARWVRPTPSFGLGAMLPDLLGMCGAAIAEPPSDDLADGIAFHHRTDAVFHALPSFVELSRAARHALRDAGVPRGPALAAAHVGVELLLDGVLVEETSAEAAFAEALATPLKLRTPFDTTRFAGLREGLRAADVPRSYGDPTAVATRLMRVLAHRPRLRLDDPVAITTFTHKFAPQVRERTPALVKELRAGLA